MRQTLRAVESRTATRTSFFTWPLVCALFLALLAAVGSRYGYHRDELYFLEAGRHPAWGYADQPPLVPLAATAWHWLTGGSLWAFRLVPAVAGAVVVALAASTARELGGDRRDAAWSAAVVGTSTTLLVTAHLFGTTVFDIAASAGLVLLLLRALRTGTAADWLALGLLAAVALNIKLLPGLLLMCCAIALLLVGPRQWLRRPWPFLAGAVAVLGASGTLLWQHANGWPQLSLASSVASGGSGSSVDRWLFVPMLITLTGPPAAAILVVGAVALWRRPTHRWVLVAVGLHLVATLATGGKPYYLMPWVPVLVAAAVPRLRAWAQARRGRSTLLISVFALNAVSGVFIALPVLPPRLAPVALVYDHGEQVGWEDLTSAVVAADAPEPADVVLTGNYGEAGALDLARRNGLPLPPVYSGHNAYGWWGPPPETARSVIVVGWWDAATLDRWFAGCTLVGHVRNDEGVANEENGAPVHRCEAPRTTWRDTWPHIRHLG